MNKLGFHTAIAQLRSIGLTAEEKSIMHAKLHNTISDAKITRKRSIRSVFFSKSLLFPYRTAIRIGGRLMRFGTKAKVA